MSIKHVEGDAVKALLNKEIDFLVHCCNNKGVMGSGIARHIREQIPESYKAYKKGSYGMGSLSLGGGLINLVGQDGYGYDGQRYGHYGYIAKGLSNIRYPISNYIDFYDSTLHDKFYGIGYGKVTLGFPFRFASDRAGCDWGVILELIEGILIPEFDVVIYELNTCW